MPAVSRSPCVRLWSSTHFANSAMDSFTSLYSTEASEENGPETCDGPSAENEFADAFGDLADLPVEVDDRRPTCLRCR